MITAFGTGIHDDFDISKLRYDKIIHLFPLLLCALCQRYQPMVSRFFTYLAFSSMNSRLGSTLSPPLYKLEKNKKIWYAYSDEELDGILLEVGRGRSQ